MGMPVARASAPIESMPAVAATARPSVRAVRTPRVPCPMPGNFLRRGAVFCQTFAQVLTGRAPPLRLLPMAKDSAAAIDRSVPASGMLEPEVVLPSQLIDRNRLGAALQPEKRLALAVLEDAVASFQRHATSRGRAAERTFREAKDWLFDDDVTWAFSFVNICNLLGLDPSYLRRGLELWTTGRAASATGKVIPFRYQFRRISGSRTRAVVPRALRDG